MNNLAIILLAGNKAPNVQLSISNISDTCYLVSEIPLMLDGTVRQKNFILIDKTTHEQLEYQGIYAKSAPTYIRLEAGQEIKSPEIDLSTIYNMEDHARYEVYYQAMLAFSECSHPEEIYTGFIESNHIEIFND